MKESAPPKRVLIYRLGSLGDTVVALPAFHLVERAFPQAERRLLTNLPVATKVTAPNAVLESTGLVHGYFSYKTGERRWKKLLALRRELRAWQPEALVYLSDARGLMGLLRDWLFFRSCGIQRMYGLPWRGSERAMQANADGRLEHVSAYLARRLAKCLGDAGTENAANWDLRLTAKETACAEESLKAAGGRPVLAVCVGTKVQSKDWGIENWTALLGRLGGQYPEHALVLVGAKEDAEAAAAAAAAWQRQAAHPLTLNLCGALTPRESAAVLQRAQLYLGLDSGPMHLAAAMGTRCVAIFAAHSLPAVWFPHGDGHRVLYHRVECAGCELANCVVQKKKCILSITVDEVADAVKAAMAG